MAKKVILILGVTNRCGDNKLFSVNVVAYVYRSEKFGKALAEQATVY